MTNCHGVLFHGPLCPGMDNVTNARQKRECLMHIWDWKWEMAKPIPNFWDWEWE